MQIENIYSNQQFINNKIYIYRKKKSKTKNHSRITTRNHGSSVWSAQRFLRTKRIKK